MAGNLVGNHLKRPFVFPQILSRASERFNLPDLLALSDRLEFVYLRRRRWVEAERYPVFTLLGQSLGSVVLGETSCTVIHVN